MLQGSFGWTGFDYRAGEKAWPAVVANSGVLDLAGYLKGKKSILQA